VDFQEQLQVFQTRVEAALEQWVPLDSDTPPRLKEAMRHSLFAGGKRVRPILLLSAFELAPRLIDPLPAAVALECVHTYSLIHDDLPSMDDSALRRGHPTCHVAYDEATAVLAGDALLTLAFEIMAEQYAEYPKELVSLIKELSHAAGSAGMVGGQIKDILLEQSDTDVSFETIEQIEDKKTGALLTASLRMGFILSAMSPGMLEHADALGKVIGRSYQIVDDILDATSDEATLGKSVKADERNKKITAVDHLGLDGARAEVDKLIAQGMKILKKIPSETAFLEKLLMYLKTRIS
jgi:geranylgeranyl diphosphate synthase type II